MENPLDNAGEAVEGVGKGIGDLLHGTARFLEQLTGDAYSAVIFAGFLLFSLSLIRGGATSRNHGLYAASLLVIGASGLLLFAGLAVAAAFPDFLSLYEPNPERDFLYKGLTSFDFGEEYKARFIILDLPARMARYKWFSFLLLDMMFVGLVMFAISSLYNRFRSDSD